MMKVTISDEQRRAHDQMPEDIEVEDTQSQKAYVLTDAELHHRAMATLKQQEDRVAIQAGIDDMEAGRVEPYEDVSRRIHTHLQKKHGLPLGDV